MKKLILILILLSLGAAAFAGGARRSVVLNTWPQGAECYLQLSSTSKEGEYLGRSGRPFDLDLRRFAGQSGFTVTFRLTGYRVKQERISAFHFEKSGTYPEKGAIRLDPEIPVAADLYYLVKANLPLSLALLALAALYVARVVLPKRAAARRTIARAAMWDELARGARPDEPMLGKCYGRYRIIDRIGAGGMGSVYRAVPSDTLRAEQMAAIKLINADASGQPDFVERFRRETRITAELNHPNILKVLDYGEESGELYLVTEYIAGKTLRSSVVPGGLPLDRFASVFTQLCAALACAHDKGIVHRDLKPENVMITPDGRVLLMDFGLAKGFQHTAITMSGTAIGTPAYMAPEQITKKELDHRSDQYALGVVAFELLAGRLPFVEEEIIHLLMSHVNEEPPALRSLRPSLPAALEGMVMRMLAKSPQDRFYDMREVLAAFEVALAAQGKGEERR